MKVVISYAKADMKHANQIVADLEKSNINPWIDRKSIDDSTVWLREIDKALTDADFVLGVITNNYIDSTGGLEGFATISTERKKKKKKFLPLFFQSPDTLNSMIIPALQGIRFDVNYEKGFSKLLDKLSRPSVAIATEVRSRIESPDYGNPFYRVRTELYGDDYKLIAKAFTQPESTLYEQVQGNTPVYLFGGRGVGKTMLLKSLTPAVVCSRQKVTSFRDAKEKGTDFFGFYFRLKRGSLIYYNYGPIIEIALRKVRTQFDYNFYKNLLEKANSCTFEEANADPVLSTAFDIIRVITSNELNYRLLQTVLKDLSQYLQTGLLTLDATQERAIVEGIAKLLDPTNKLTVSSFQDLLDIISQELKKIDDYVQSQALPSEMVTNPNWIKTSIDFIDSSLSVLRKHVGDFQNINFYFLFDEFDNLIPVQQTIINEWVKTAKNFVVKVSSKFKGMYTHATLQGQPIQFGQDCPEVILDYNLFDETEFACYQNLLGEICSKLLDIAGYPCTQIKDLLELPVEPELPQHVIDAEVKNMRESANLDFDVEKIVSYRGKHQEAAIFRLLRKKGKVQGRATRQKRYCGYDTFTYLSSGIIRIFLNLAGAALYKAEEEKLDIRGGDKIPVACQTWAANIVSTAWLDRIRTVYDMHQHGEKTHQLVLDLGDIFRERLLHHYTEPETITVTIKYPLSLRTELCSELMQIFNDGTKESVFYERKESMKPKGLLATQTKEYVLNRIYAPVLKLSYRPRWPRASTLTTEDLLGLLDENKRPATKSKLLKQQHPKASHPTFDVLEASHE